jgi:hypothetical protein
MDGTREDQVVLAVENAGQPIPAALLPTIFDPLVRAAVHHGSQEQGTDSSVAGANLGLGLYVGHGRPMGWVGYHGVRAHHFLGSEEVREPRREPMGAILSLCCRTASRRRVGLSYTESLPLMGVAAASFGAVKETFHSDNTRWAVGVCTALTEGARTVGELLVRAAPASPAALASYRLIGDPFAPLGSDDRSLRRANRVRTYE